MEIFNQLRLRVICSTLGNYYLESTGTKIQQGQFPSIAWFPLPFGVFHKCLKLSNDAERVTNVYNYSLLSKIKTIKYSVILQSLISAEMEKLIYSLLPTPQHFLLVPFKRELNKLHFNEKLQSTSVPTVGRDHMSYLSSQLNIQPPQTLTYISCHEIPLPQ